METELEHHEIELKYSRLSICDAKTISKLTESIEIHGQQSPVLVVRAEQKYVLIDGYRRILAVKRLRLDTVRASILDMSEKEALFFRHRLEYSTKRTALEEAWFLREVMSVHGLSQEEAAVRLNRSRSFVSRRLSLISVLGPKVQNSIRQGSISSQAAMKYLVPLSRANREHGEMIAENLKGKRISVREMGELYLAWKKGSPENKLKIASSPSLFIKHISKAVQPESQREEKNEFNKDMNIISAVCRRTAEKVRKTGVIPLRKNWNFVISSFNELKSAIEGKNER